VKPAVHMHTVTPNHTTTCTTLGLIMDWYKESAICQPCLILPTTVAYLLGPTNQPIPTGNSSCLTTVRLFSSLGTGTMSCQSTLPAAESMQQESSSPFVRTLLLAGIWNFASTCQTWLSACWYVL
jgi:hypothetical protein